MPAAIQRPSGLKATYSALVYFSSLASRACSRSLTSKIASPSDDANATRDPSGLKATPVRVVGGTSSELTERRR